MGTIGLFYASTTGNTEVVAEQIAGLLGSQRVDMHDLATDSCLQMENYDYLVLGIPTWDYGELQEDWDAIWPELERLDLTGRKVALFGLGDQLGYGEWFLDAMGLLGDLMRSRGAELVAPWSVDGYQFEQSKALTADGAHFVGLAIDEDGQPGETANRIARWVPEVLSGFEL
ncbi:MAG: flavodoxin FldB [Oceanospirillaceae bacterium]|nr:flavodoxin FldB [Oceanospirillaceae bacterium]